MNEQRCAELIRRAGRVALITDGLERPTTYVVTDYDPDEVRVANASLERQEIPVRIMLAQSIKISRTP